MENKPNYELSEELMKELKINSIEEYNNIVMDDKKVQKNSVKSKKADKSQSKSKTQMKIENRKKEQIVQKKRKNETRNTILNSLAKYNTEEALKKLENLESSRNLSLRKRKISKELSHRLSVDSKFKQTDNSNSSLISEHSDQDDENIDSNCLVNKKDIPINDKENINNKNEVTNHIDEKKTFNVVNEIKDPWKLLDPSIREQIISEIKSYREKESTVEETIDEDIINDIEIPSKDHTILVNRNGELAQSRLELPIIKYEQEIMDCINHSLVTIISGETGSGKSTQIPQFIYEYGYTKTLGHIAITQPRRLAAVALSNRVSLELNLTFGMDVGYQIRYDSQNCSENTEIKYMTDGILLKEIENDAFLFRYSVVVIDEAHERSINTDILIGLLSKVIKYRYMMSKNKIVINKKPVKPLRLIIMSATLRVDEFMNERIFTPKPKYIKVEARQYPVTVHHLKRTPEDYLRETFKVVCKIHSKLPSGGILVFLTGKKEINELCEKLRVEFNNNLKNTEEDNNSQQIVNNKKEEEMITNDNYEIENDDVSINSEDRLSVSGNKEESESKQYSEAVILPLYSSLSQIEQNRVFQKDLGNKRLIVVSTNVAETSLTIPNIKYVVDCGKEKKRIISQGLSFSCFRIEFISQASAEQRTGRAGRTGPGHCYRIYSNGLFAKMKKFNDPQIITSQLDQMILYLKTLRVKDINNFPFLTFPEGNLVDRSIRHLLVLGAISSENEPSCLNTNIIRFQNKKIEDKNKITDIGLLMSKFPLPPKYARMIIVGKKLGLILHTIFMVSTLNQESIFMSQNINLKKTLESPLLNLTSDHITYTNIVIELFNLKNFDQHEKYYKFVEKYQINLKVIKEIFDLLYQLIRISKIVFRGEEDKSLDQVNSKVNIPTIHQQKILIQVLLCGLIENIAKKREIYDSIGNEKEKVVKKRMIYESNESNEECQLSKHSVVENSDLICYKEIIKENKANLVCNTVIQAEWLYNLGGELVSYNMENFVREPFYLENRIYCLLDIKFGYKDWTLHGVRVELNKKDDCFYRWFARFILEGKVFPKFKVLNILIKEYEKYYISKPNTITNGLSLDRKVFALVNALKNYGLWDKGKLVEKWGMEKSFLLDTFCLWLNDNKIKSKCMKEWPLIK